MRRGADESGKWEGLSKRSLKFLYIITFNQHNGY